MDNTKIKLFNKYLPNRIGRFYYLLGQLFLVIIFFSLVIPPYLFVGVENYKGKTAALLTVWFLAVTFTCAYFNIKLIIKRGHDIGWSGLFSILFYLSGLFLFYLPNLYLLIKEGERKENKFDKKEDHIRQNYTDTNIKLNKRKLKITLDNKLKYIIIVLVTLFICTFAFIYFDKPSKVEIYSLQERCLKESNSLVFRMNEENSLKKYKNISLELEVSNYNEKENKCFALISSNEYPDVESNIELSYGHSRILFDVLSNTVRGSFTLYQIPWKEEKEVGCFLNMDTRVNCSSEEEFNALIFPLLKK